MASRLTPLGFVVKWFLVPLSLGAVGYFLVGPRVESQVPKELRERVQKAAGSDKEKAEPDGEAKTIATPNHNFTAPEIDVTVSALNSRETRPKKKRRRKRTKPPVQNSEAPSAPVASPPPSDGADPGTPG